MRVHRLAVVVCALLLVAGPVAAQEQRGAIEGVAKDTSGGVLPGVTVEARSPALIGVATAVTDTGGLYRFPGLPPGVYEIAGQLAGFNPVKVPNVQLSLGQILKVNLAMQVAGIVEEVRVVAGSPLIDVKQSASFNNIRGEFLAQLPRGRDFTSVVTVAPGTNDESKLAGISIDGAAGSENRYVVDGQDTTDLQTGQSGKRMITDVIDEVQVKSSGYNAEYGGATGGVISVITKTGSNQWRGDAGFYFSSDNLDGPARQVLRLGLVDDRIAEYVTYSKDNYSTWEPGFTLGGPVIKDRIWFFTSYIPQLTSTDRTVNFRTDGQTQTITSDEKTHYSTSNISTQLGNKTRVRFAMSFNPYARRGQLPALDGTGNPVVPYATLGQDKSNKSYSGNIDFTPTNHLYMAVRGGYFSYNTEDIGVPTDVRVQFSGSNLMFPEVPLSLQRLSGFQTVPNNTAIVKDTQSRASVNADLTYYASFAGQHTLKGGIQFDRPFNDVDRHTLNSYVTLYWDRTLTTLDGRRVRGTYGYYRAQDVGTFGAVHSNNLGFFIQDAWTVNNRLTINAGLRTEQESIPSFRTDLGQTPVAIKLSFKDKLAPRLGFAWDMQGNGRSKLYGSWGVFYDIMKLSLPRGQLGGEKQLNYYFALDTYDWTKIGGPGCPPACPGTYLDLVDGRLPANNPGHNRIDPDLHPMKAQEFTVGFDREINATTSVGLRYVHKWLNYAIDDVGVIVAGGNDYFLCNPGFGWCEYTIGREFPAQPKATRKYDGFEVRLRRRMANRWSLNASYLLSRLWGNYAGLASSDEVSATTGVGRASPNLLGYFDEIIQSFDERAQPVFGRLPTDRPHQLKAQVFYDFPFGTSVGLTQTLASGTPVTRSVEMQIIQGRVMYKGRGTDGRTPVFYSTGAYVQHRFKLPGNMALSMSLNVLNLFDQKILTERWTNYETRDIIAISDRDFFRGFDTQALIRAQNIRLDPRFLQPILYQNPRTMRLNVKFSF